MVGGTAPNLARLLTRKFVTQIPAVSNQYDSTCDIQRQGMKPFVEKFVQKQRHIVLSLKKAFLIIINKFYNPSFSFSQHLI